MFPELSLAVAIIEMSVSIIGGMVEFMPTDLDHTDIQVLDALQRDAGLSAAELAERCNLTTTTAWRRLRRLEAAGVIQGRVAILNRREVGLHVLVFAQVKLMATGREALARFEQAVRGFPEVLDCYSLLGEKGFLLRIAVPSIDAYEAFFLDHLSRIPGLQAVNSNIALSTIKPSKRRPRYPWTLGPEPTSHAAMPVDVPDEVTALEDGLERWQDRLTFVSDEQGCGCCVSIFDVEGPRDAIDAIPPFLCASSEWSNS